MQVASKIVKAGPDNATVYMKGMGIMYKEHDILVEVNNDGSGVICERPHILVTNLTSHYVLQLHLAALEHDPSAVLSGRQLYCGFGDMPSCEHGRAPAC